VMLVGPTASFEMPLVLLRADELPALWAYRHAEKVGNSIDTLCLRTKLSGM
jgi:hypothetical protein